MDELLGRKDLHPYQIFSTKFILEHEEAALLLDCGLGKTVITLSAIMILLSKRKVRKVLVICPIRVAFVWENEVKKWKHLKGLRVSRATGTAEERKAALDRDADIYVINRENVPWLIKTRKFVYDMVVVDELSSFKNGKTKRFRALMHVRPWVKRIVGLTGTPSPNGLMDLFAEYKVLDRGTRLGHNITAYRNKFFIPCRGSGGRFIVGYKLRPGADQKIYQAISDMTISMKCQDYLQMPELIRSSYPVFLDEDERSVYQEMKEKLQVYAENGTISADNMAVLTGKLTQIANGAIYTDEGNTEIVHSRKLDALEDIIEAACGKPILVAYWFRHDLLRIRELLDKMNLAYAILDKDKNIDLWNQRKLDVGLIHPAAAGHGLNLQNGGDTLIWFGMIWSLELYQQTVARIWRQGQKSRTVVIQHIIAEDTVDEKILQVLMQKEATQKALIEAVKAEVGTETNHRRREYDQRRDKAAAV